MFETRRNIVLALAVFALLLPMTGSAREQVERPFKLHAEHTRILNFADWTWTTGEESGVATHLGSFTSSGEGTFSGDFVGGTFRLELFTGSGYYAVANGEKLFWDVRVEGTNRPILTFTGGTGRFEGARGSVTLTITTQTKTLDWPLLTITESFSGIGTITY
jgi:hypothetical protein